MRKPLLKMEESFPLEVSIASKGNRRKFNEKDSELFLSTDITIFYTCLNLLFFCCKILRYRFSYYGALNSNIFEGMRGLIIDG